MSVFPVIDRYRRELRVMPFPRVDDEGMAELRRRRANARHSGAIEDIHPTPEPKPLIATFIEERVPPDVSGPVTLRDAKERIVLADRALAMHEAI